MVMANAETRIISIVVNKPGEPIFSETATTISIEDDAAGEYVTVCQNTDAGGDGKFSINPEEWPAMRRAINKMIKECRNAD
jgi:hypothetical protein